MEESKKLQNPAPPPRKRGAPKSNQNARRYGFYSKALDEAEQLDLELVAGVEGIDDEIALLRVKIKTLLGKDPENLRLIMQAMDSLARLVKTRYSITREQKKGLKEAIGNVFRDIAIPLGINIGTEIGKKILK